MRRIAVLTLLGLMSAAVPAAAAERWKRPFTSVMSGPSDLPAECRQKQFDAWPQIAVHPDEPRRLSGLYLSDGIEAGVGVTSEDGGRSWTRSAIPAATSCTGGPPEREVMVNPQVAAGPGGRSYVGNSWVGREKGGPFSFGVLVHARDRSGGWVSPVSPAGDYAQNIAIVPDRGDPAALVAVWTHHDQVTNPFTYAQAKTDIWSAISRDGGRTWADAGPAVIMRPDRIVVNVRALETSDGGVLALFDAVPVSELPKLVTGEPIEFEVKAIRSDDGGRTWSRPVGAGLNHFFLVKDPERRDPENAPGGAVAGNAKFDLAVGPEGQAAVVAARPLPDGGHAIQMTSSSDGGRSWSRPRDVMQLPTVIQPAVAIGRDGTLGLFWYDWADDAAGDELLSTTPWFAASRDGGRTWTKRRLARPFDLLATYEEGLDYDGFPIGVYQELVALKRGFGAAFSAGPPLARDGKMDPLFAKVVRRRARKG